MSKYVLVFIASFLLCTVALENFKNEFQTVILKGVYYKNITLKVDTNNECIIRFVNSTSKYPYVVRAWSQKTFYGRPVFIGVRQQQSVTSWELPFLVQSQSGVVKFVTSSRTLCHDSMAIIAELPRNITHQHKFHETNIMGIHKELTMSISTTSLLPIEVTINVEEEKNFYIEENKLYLAAVSPSEPRFFYYKFPDRNDTELSKTVIFEIASEYDVCMTVSIQNPSCPVSDLNDNIWYQGKYQTLNNKGGIIIKEVEFPQGFLVVFVAKGDNHACSRESSVIPRRSVEIIKPVNQSSIVKFSIEEGITKDDYILASLLTLAIIFTFYIIFAFTTWAFYRWSYKLKPIERDIPMQPITETTNNHSALAETVPALDEIDKTLGSCYLVVADLAKKKEKHFVKKTNGYLWHVISVAIFYGIPVVQLVVSYQRIVNISGNQDICYYNFLCAHPLIGFSDFNHIYSNIGYVLAGILFLIITFYKKLYVLSNPGYGIPKHYGLFYSMGVAVIMEGILSASYHVCPNQWNFQFDTSFMYVIAILCIIQLYQNRHPDINASAYVTFVILGFAIFAVMVGILNGNIAIWIIFILAYIILCVYVSFNIYFISYIKRGFHSMMVEYTVEHNVLKVIQPKRKAHFIILVIANIFNIIFAFLGILCYFMGTDFATFLLGLLMANGILYMIVYIIMKFVNHEKLCLQATIFGILGLATWMGAMYFFINNSTMWTATPAESRQFNTHCIMLDFYDHHDVWHLLSAAALFFSFMLLLSLDDDLVNTPLNKIAVF